MIKTNLWTLAGAALAMTAAGAHAQSQTPAPVEMGALSTLNAWTVGSIARNQGALPQTMWAESDAAQIGALMERLPDTFDSPAAFSLARRVLASAADAPDGEAGAEAARQRFEALGRIGLADDLATMAAGAGASALSDPSIAQFAAQAELARGRANDACQRARLVNAEAPPPFILRVRAFCAAAVGETAAADLALEVARSANAEDAWLRSAIGAMAAPPARAVPARYDTSLNASASLAARLTPGANPLNNSSTLALITVARSENAPAALRAQAAALAFRRGVLGVAPARAALMAEGVTTGLSPLTVAARQAQATPGTLEAATAIAAALRQSSSYMDFFAAARLFRDDIAQLTAAPDHAAAINFARAAVAIGDMQLGARLAENAAAAGATQTQLAALSAALAIGARMNAEDAALVIPRRIEAGGSARAVSRDVIILSAMGFPSNGAARAHLSANAAQGGRRADQGLLAALNAAAQAGATGEAALLAALICADGAGSLDADSLATVIRALRTADLADSARGIAIEALNAGAPS
ncbi:MAG: hypothetical protein AB7J28_15940 [Hyphomonadaceae bacterium]